MDMVGASWSVLLELGGAEAKAQPLCFKATLKASFVLSKAQRLLETFAKQHKREYQGHTRVIVEFDGAGEI